MTEWEWLLVWVAGWLGVAEILGYFWISWEWLIIMSVMLVLDFIFWLLSAKSRGEKIESKKWQHWLVKKLTRWLLPFIVVAWLRWTGMWGIDALVNIIVWMIVFSELYSIIWHIYSINYWEELPEVDSFKLLLNWLLKLIRTLINKKEEELNPKDKDLSE